jgi:hypothetical protein
MDLQTRVVNILTKPASEWSVIATEQTDIATIYRTYIVILAAIPAVSLFLGYLLFGVGTFGLTLAVRAGVFNYIGALVGAYLAALVIEKLAPSFGSSGDTVQALKLVAYASTPMWLAGVLNLVLLLSVLQLVGALYAIYLFYLGLTPLMKTPQDKVVPYMLVSAVVVVVVSIVVGSLMAVFGGVSGYGRMF